MQLAGIDILESWYLGGRRLIPTFGFIAISHFRYGYQSFRSSNTKGSRSCQQIPI